MEKLLPLFTGKILSVVCTQIFQASFHLNTSLVYYTPFFIGVFSLLSFRYFKVYKELEKLKKTLSKNA